MPRNPRPNTHLYILLDRSGSMESMKADVIGGFNRLLADQLAAGDDARITLIQFDTNDPEEVLLNGTKLSTARPLSGATFVPRGGTPLLDATGRLIARATARADQRRVLGKRPEHLVLVTVTDGEENQSTQFSRADIKRLIAAKQELGWTFAFLGAGVDAYGEAGGIGVDTRSVQAFAPTAAGAAAAFDSVSKAVRTRRAKVASGVAFEAADLFEGAKDAERA